MDDALLMGVVNRIADPGEQLEPLRQVESVAGGVVGEGLATDQLHREERLGPTRSLGSPGLVDLGDSGMLQPAEHLGLPGKAPGQLIRHQAGPDDLERHGSVRLILLGLIDGAHAALAERGDDPVPADRRCRHAANLSTGSGTPTNRAAGSASRARLRPWYRCSTPCPPS